MNINGDQWRAGTGCRWMAFCSASDSSAPLMGSAWLDSIMSPDTLWRGCKLSIRPLSPPLMLPRLLLLSSPRSPWSSCHHSPCSYSPFSLLTAFYILAPPPAFMFGLPRFALKILTWISSRLNEIMSAEKVMHMQNSRKILLVYNGCISECLCCM